MKELHSAIVETGRMLQDASGSGCDAYEAALRTHLHHLINIAVGKLEQQMEGFTDSPVSYHLPQEIMETLGLGGNTQSQLLQDNADVIAASQSPAEEGAKAATNFCDASSRLCPCRRTGDTTGCEHAQPTEALSAAKQQGRDAERYRWLSDEQIFALFLRSGIGKYHVPRQDFRVEYDKLIAEFARAAIDAATGSDAGDHCA